MKRKSSFRPARSLLLAAILAGPLCAEAFAAEGPPRPNIVLILADDLGWAELGCYGNTFNETPNLDQMARQGMRFTQAYAAAPVCSPTRAALMTGQWPARIGITDYLRADDPRFLSAEQCLALPRLLRQAGYTSGLIGKWHLMGDYSRRQGDPRLHGFDEVICCESRYIGPGYYYPPYQHMPEVKPRLGPREYLVDRLNLEAVEFIQRHKERPFFLFLSHYAPHTRLVGKPELVAKYQRKPGAGQGQRAGRNNPHLAAMLESIDQGVGQIMATLRQAGLADRTILVFTSDNGGEVGVTTNAPLRAGKSTLYEGGIRVPLIVRWPAVIQPGSTSHTPVATVDFYPTFAAAAQVPLPAGHPIDGVSILPLLRDPATLLAREALYWHYPLDKPHFLGGKSSGAVRIGSWKLIQDYTTGAVELYELTRDPGEKHDLAPHMPDKARDLYEKLKAWQTTVGARAAPYRGAAPGPQTSPNRRGSCRGIRPFFPAGGPWTGATLPWGAGRGTLGFGIRFAKDRRPGLRLPSPQRTTLFNPPAFSSCFHVPPVYLAGARAGRAAPGRSGGPAVCGRRRSLMARNSCGWIAAALAVALLASGLAPAWAAEAKKGAKAPDKERVVALDQVPGPAKAAILNLAGKNKIVSIEELATREGKLYEATWMAGGKEVEVLLSEKGKVLTKGAAKEGKQPKREKPKKGEKAEKAEKASKQKEAKPEKGKHKVEDENAERAKGPKAKARKAKAEDEDEDDEDNDHGDDE
ncbi:MAG: sulfatase-like hydrolase/transferase [Thermoguttaceae bacterium]